MGRQMKNRIWKVERYRNETIFYREHGAKTYKAHYHYGNIVRLGYLVAAASKYTGRLVLWPYGWKWILDEDRERAEEEERMRFLEWEGGW